MSKKIYNQKIGKFVSSKVSSAELHRDSKFAELIEEGKKSGVASDKKIKKEFAKRGLKF